MFLIMICTLIVLIAQNITETDEIKNMKNNYSTKHECSTKHELIPPSAPVLVKLISGPDPGFSIGGAWTHFGGVLASNVGTFQ